MEKRKKPKTYHSISKEELGEAICDTYTKVMSQHENDYKSILSDIKEEAYKEDFIDNGSDYLISDKLYQPLINGKLEQPNDDASYPDIPPATKEFLEGKIVRKYDNFLAVVDREKLMHLLYDHREEFGKDHREAHRKWRILYEWLRIKGVIKVKSSEAPRYKKFCDCVIRYCYPDVNIERMRDNMRNDFPRYPKYENKMMTPDDKIFYTNLNWLENAIQVIPPEAGNK